MSWLKIHVVHCFPKRKRVHRWFGGLSIRQILRLRGLGLSTVRRIDGITVAVTVRALSRFGPYTSTVILQYFTDVCGRKYGYHYVLTLR